MLILMLSVIFALVSCQSKPADGYQSPLDAGGEIQETVYPPLPVGENEAEYPYPVVAENAEIEAVDVVYPGPEEAYPYPSLEQKTVSERQTESGADDPGLEAPAIKEPISRELHASSPETFSIASGDVQLVEFFAFW